MGPIVKHFNDLTNRELYEILRARVNIFVVEQNCPYPEIDGLDVNAYHVFYMENDAVTACLRFFEREKGLVQLGRVLTIEHGKGLGGKLLREGIEELKRIYAPKKVILEAQTYAIGYYGKAGFNVTSEEFMEDGIPHVMMELDL